MATVRELSAPYENFLLSPRHGPGVCVRCFNLTDGYEQCYTCARQPSALDAVVPISYSIAHEQLHHALASYKRIGGAAGRRLAVQLAAVLWRYLDQHEGCIARAIGLPAFPVVATVPSGDSARDEDHPLRWIVSTAVKPTRHRHQRLLRRSQRDVAARAFDADKYQARRPLAGEAVLLIDDTWTTGANAQSAAAELKAAGAGAVAGVVIGRHVNRQWRQNDRHLRSLEPFDWRRCALCAGADDVAGRRLAANAATPPVPG
jgi:predicted amidophosphoribosyltransferase